ncbi:MAG TPA: methylthioribulose 1-phosphate dehydratase [Saprospiraceae bacterium]|nr:methylthioribulose 1-phosphate dehydratase [Saprospiraceae bacterium]HMP14345.1 methylthioribulose 1-phosphate dehydratase [Saprospiraceae bacterium]
MQTNKAALTKVIHFLHAQGWAPATSSNYSFRQEGDPNFYVSESGIDKGSFSEQHFLYVNANGEPIEDMRRPSAETLLHSVIYQCYPDMHCVLHTHSIMGTVLSKRLLPQGAIFLSDYEILKGFSGITTHEVVVKIPIFANTQDIPALAATVQRYAQQETMRAFLIAGHGMYTWGRDIAEAKRHVEVVEFLLECLGRG